MPPSRPTAENAGRFQILIGDRRGNEIDDKIDALSASRVFDLVGPAWIGRVEREIAAEFAQSRTAISIGRSADHQRGAHELANLHAHEADAGAGPLHQHGLATL
jgi:hypothetical protein